MVYIESCKEKEIKMSKEVRPLNIKTQLPIVAKKECGTCTKCCEGILNANIRGHDMGFGKPCFFVEIGKGCGDYSNRPEHPCKSYSCIWLLDPDIPDWLKPEKSNVIIDAEEIDGMVYLRLVGANSDVITTDILSWALVYSKKKNCNISWDYNQVVYWLGSDEFCNAMEAKYGSAV